MMLVTFLRAFWHSRLWCFQTINASLCEGVGEEAVGKYFFGLYENLKLMLRNIFLFEQTIPFGIEMP